MADPLGDQPKEKVRRGYSSLDAVDPRDGKQWHVLLADSKMDWVAQQGEGRTRELAHTVRWSLMNPRAIFRGVRDDTHGMDEDEWLAYVATPPKAYDHKTGREVPPWPNEVFLVFVSEERVIYNWYWSECDRYDSHLPEDYESRFDERLL